jgi:hypothetical protein
MSLVLVVVARVGVLVLVLASKGLVRFFFAAGSVAEGAGTVAVVSVEIVRLV